MQKPVVPKLYSSLAALWPVYSPPAEYIERI